MRRPDKKSGTASRARRPKSPRRRTAPKALLRRQLNEALEQQAATAEILSIISSSPTDTQPVFDAIVQSGLKLFPHALISVALRDGDMFKIVAIAERDPDRAEAWRRTSPSPLTREYMHGIAILGRKTVDIADIRKASLEIPTGAQKFLTSGYRAITIRDNGTGMMPDVKEKMFNPFFTTKPTGEGTGLGLSISHDIIVKQHGGSIEVDTQPGEFTEIRVILPRVAALLPEHS